MPEASTIAPAPADLGFSGEILTEGDAGYGEANSRSGGGYLNYMQADEPLERVRAAYGAERFERLRAVKRRYDPDNVLRFNQNIPPGD